MGRRSAWDEMAQAAGRGETVGQATGWAPAAAPVQQPKTVLEGLPVAEERTRAADGPRTTQVLTLRGVPEQIQDRVRKAAGQWGVPMGEAVQWLLEQALAAYGQGRLTVQPVLSAGRRTLYPTGDAAKVNGQARRVERRKQKKDKTWSVRGPGLEAVRQALAELAEEREVSIGELARLLLEWGLGEVDAGRLTAAVYEIAVKNSLYEGE